MFFSDSVWTVFFLTTVVIGTALAVHVVLRPYADHELNHGDEDSHDRSVWTDADMLDAIGMVCTILAAVSAIYYLNLGENPEQTTVYYSISVVALVVAIFPPVLSAKYAWDAHCEQKNGPVEAADKPGKDSDEGKVVVENPLSAE